MHAILVSDPSSTVSLYRDWLGIELILILDDSSCSLMQVKRDFFQKQHGIYLLALCVVENNNRGHTLYRNYMNK